MGSNLGRCSLKTQYIFAIIAGNICNPSYLITGWMCQKPLTDSRNKLNWTVDSDHQNFYLICCDLDHKQYKIQPQIYRTRQNLGFNYPGHLNVVAVSSLLSSDLLYLKQNHTDQLYKFIFGNIAVKNFKMLKSHFINFVWGCCQV